MGERTSTPEIGTVQSATRAMGQRVHKSLGKKKKKLPEMLFVRTVRKDSRTLCIKYMTKGKGRTGPG